jgi:WD40-like Beta Propeller Repeat
MPITQITLVSSDAGSNVGNSSSYESSRGSAFSADGRYVAFYSQASNLVSGVITRVSTDASAQGNSGSYEPNISADGRYVAFSSDASNLVSGDTNGSRDVFATLSGFATNAAPVTDLNDAGAGNDNTASFTEQTPVLIAPAATVTDSRLGDPHLADRDADGAPGRRRGRVALMTYLFTKYDREERVLDHRITAVRLVQQIIVLRNKATSPPARSLISPDGEPPQAADA